MSEIVYPATRVISKFVADLKFEDIPRKDLEYLKLDILDTIGCGIYGSTTTWGSIVAQYALEAGGPEQSGIWCRGSKVHCSNAVLANGTFVHAAELDETHQPTTVHPGSAMFTTALAMAEVVGNVSGRELLTAAAAGYELCFRVGVVTWKGLGNRGYNRTGTLGTMGAAATAAKILGLDEDRIKDAIGIAGVYASGLQSSRLSMSKRATQGRAAQQGVLGAFLAQKGFTGSDVIEASFGICDTLAGESDLSKLKDIGKTFTIHNIGFKPYTAATGIHKGLDALQKLMKSYPIDPNRVEKVIFRMPIEAAYLYMGNDPEHIKPWTIEVALYSIHYAAACMLIDGEMFIDQLNEKRIKDPRILELAMKVEITPTPELAGKGTIVEVVQGGHTYKSEPVYYSKGMPQNPMSKDELRQKFKKLARTVFQDDKIEEIVKTVENMEQIEDVAILAEKLTNIP